ncbi:MAG TPA: hypothetical protein VNP92_26750, partial [Actinophytocola sp.]|nr:hypothetical protein [Actinophytocola sp.]
WSLAYGGLGLFWTLGGPGFPFGRGHDPEADDVFSVLAGVGVDTGAPVIAVLGLLGGIAGILMARAHGRGVVRVALLAFAWTLAATLTLVVTDFRLLMLMTRVVLFPVWLFTGPPEGTTFADFVPWPRVNLLVGVIGGVLWAAAALAYARRSAGACANCGRRGGHATGWNTPAAALRWGRRAVYVAVVVPMVYVITRVAWALGIPLGIPQQFMDENAGSGMFLGGLAIATMAFGGVVLTLGLVQRWGEVYPRWIWFKAGKRVPLALAIVPASIVALFTIPAGITQIRMAVIHGVHPSTWAMTGPGWLWPLWGVALGTATYAYHLRRRAACRHCGQGGEPGEPADAEPAAEVPVKSAVDS